MAYSSITIIIYGPSTTATPANSNVGLANCYASYSVVGSSVRYGTTYTPSSASSISTGLSKAAPYDAVPSESYQFSSLSPNCTYTLNINSENTTGQSSINTWPNGSGSTSYTQPQILTSFPNVTNSPSSYNVSSIGNIISNSFSSARIVSSNTLINNLINNAAISTNNLQGTSNYGLMWATDSNYSPPNQTNMYIGTSATSTQLLMNLVATIGSTAYTTINYYGYGATTNPTVSTSTLTVSNSSSVVDQYSSGAGYNGFYTKTSGSITLTIPLGTLSASANSYTLNISQTYYSPNGSTVYSNPKTFYYDAISGSPTITSGSSNFSLQSASATLISGIDVYGTGTFTFSATTVWNNLADYF